MRGAVCLVATFLGLVGCAQIYIATSKNPALVGLPVSNGFGVGDQINLVAIDGVSVDAVGNGGDYWRIDPGPRRLTVTYEASKKIVGPRVTTSPLVLNVKLEAGTKYQIVCQSSDAGVKTFVRQQSTGRIVSDVAESSLMSAPATYPSPPPTFQIPAVRHH